MIDAEQNLFTHLRHEFLRNLQKQQSESERNLLVFSSNKFHDVGHILFAEMRTGGFCTFVVAGKADWDPAHHYYQAARTAAGRGRTIHRAFLLPTKASINNPALREQLRLDRAAGIKTSVLFVGDLISASAIPAVPSLEFGIWDDEVACVAVSQEPSALGLRATEWRVTRRPEDIESFEALKTLLLSRGIDLEPIIEGTQKFTDLEEPMMITAPLARQLAPVLCKGSYMSKEDCSWYHSSWQYLRIFNLVSTPTWHGKFYLDNLQKLASDQRHPRVLISGSADYSTLAHVLWAYREARARCDISVIDLCETPLLLCKWYAKYVGEEIAAEKQSILDVRGESPFDLITSDAFLTRFDPAERIEVVAKWGSLLRDGGKVITTVRIESRPDADVVKSSPAEVTNFRKRAAREANKWRGFLEIPEEDVAELAQRYAERMESFSLQTKEELLDLFQNAGFRCEIEMAEVPGEMKASVYARVVAEKKNA